MSDGVKVFQVGLEDLARCQRIRQEVFVIGQGVPVEIEVDGKDPECLHVLATLDGRDVGTARLRAVDGHAKAERVAVLAGLRGSGIGRALMATLETVARDQGHDVLHLHAQEAVLRFYDLLGYARQGERFYEANIPHLAMYKALS